MQTKTPLDLSPKPSQRKIKIKKPKLVQYFSKSEYLIPQTFLNPNIATKILKKSKELFSTKTLRPRSKNKIKKKNSD